MKNNKSKIKDDPNKLLSRKEVAARLGLSIMTIKRYENKGTLPPLKLSPRTIRHTPESIEQFLKDSEVSVI